jgi:hypothetical protein
MTNTKLVALSLAPLFLWVGNTSAGETMLDLIPADAGAAVAIRNLNDLKKKGDRFIADTEMKVPLRPSQVFEMGYQHLGINAGVDFNGSAAIVLANPVAVGVQTWWREWFQLIVVAVPFTDLDKLAPSFGIKAAQLKPGKVVSGKGMNFGRFFCARGKHLFLAENKKALISVAKGKTLAGELPLARRQRLADADLLIHLGVETFRDEWRGMVTGDRMKELEASVGRRGDKEEREAFRQFTEALASLRYWVGGVRFDGGLGIHFLAVFPKAGNGAARKFLSNLAGGRGAARLTGLPAGRVILAESSRGNGARTVMLAKVLFAFLLKNTVETEGILSAADRPNFVGVFTEVWRRLRGSRVAVYRNDNEPRLGLFSMAAVLDTADPAKFLSDLRELAHMAEGSKLDLKTRTGPDSDVAKIERLVGDLAANRYRVRQAAETRLALLGEPALPFIEKAVRSDDLEVSRRAGRLRDRITKAAAQRRKELLSKVLPPTLKPVFAFVPAAEERAGHRVHVVTVKLMGKDKAYVPQLRQLLGPDWDKIRLAVHDKAIVVLWGSDLRLLDATLKNLQDNRPGLRGAKDLAAFERQSNPARQVEFHVAMESVLGLIVAPRSGRPGPAKASRALSSVALTVDPDLVQLDLRVPSAEVKAVMRQRDLR